MARTRSLAASLAGSGHLRINGQRAPGAGKQVKIGDVLTIALERETRVLRIAGFAERRGPFEEARLLYEDIGAPGA